MYSRARIAGRPVHPMLVVLPFGLYLGTVAAMLAYVGTADAFYYRAAETACLAGVVTALLAALPGAIDLLALPRGSRVRGVAIKHASLALLATGLYAMSAATMVHDATTGPLDIGLPLALAVAGMLVLVIVGLLGWSLVQTHHVGVRPLVARERRVIPAAAVDEYDDFSTPPVGARAMMQ